MGEYISSGNESVFLSSSIKMRLWEVAQARKVPIPEIIEEFIIAGLDKAASKQKLNSGPSAKNLSANKELADLYHSLGNMPDACKSLGIEISDGWSMLSQHAWNVGG